MNLRFAVLLLLGFAVAFQNCGNNPTDTTNTGDVATTASGFPINTFQQFDQPNLKSIAVDSQGRIYVNGGRDGFSGASILVYDSNGVFLERIGENGSLGVTLSVINGLHIDKNDNLYIVESLEKRIHKLSPTRQILFSTAPNSIELTLDITTDSLGNILTVETISTQIRILDSSGGAVTVFGISGSGIGQFSGPLGVATDSSGNIYVADKSGVIAVYDSTNTFIKNIGTPGAEPAGKLSSPAGIDINSQGFIYVSDNSDVFVEVYNSSGVHQFSFQTPDILRGTRDLIIDSFDNVYVVDSGNGKIFKFDAAGNELN